MPTEILTLGRPSRVLGRDKRFNVLLPGGYTDSGPGLPVLYLLHGYGGGRDTWLTNTSLAELVGDHRLIVVLPESGRRWFINDHAGLRYEDYFVTELVATVDEEFNTVAGAWARGIGGFSMGGASALFLALRHHGLFGVVAAHAGGFEAPLRAGDPYAEHRSAPGFVMPTVDSHERVWGPPGSATRRSYDPYRLIREWTGPPPALYLDVGTGDYDRVVRMNRGVRTALRNRGWAVEYHERPGGHDWNFVASALPWSLDFVARHLATTTVEKVGPRP
ncbi:MAG TPA: alpha/beta hydrolase-fold protein [Actinophytocola sp.]|uniref:alpha/beta hydrolase n=1 Tax=Actinophytocola sp. TaxID=1872138 RepID=UPI002DB58BD7|nr:alpha/beta hydrolase-fold protein [Actinophytocola sp.]HEU5471253.1 alpha/beta hydrolase-fold protein [Actinophytocola sp.]